MGCHHDIVNSAGICMQCQSQVDKPLPKIVECTRCHEEVYGGKTYDIPGLFENICYTCYVEVGGK
jgi:hypothetical protein